MNSSGIRAQLEDTRFFQQSSRLFHQYKRFLPVASFVAGFSWDSFTLTRIDLWSDNLILLSYLLLLGLLITIVNFVQEQVITRPFILKWQNIYPLAIQFFLGGLFSSFVVFYFKSSALSKNWIFLVLLLLILVGNEFIENRLANIKLQFSLFFLATFSFLIFFLPVLLKAMNRLTFIASGLLSLSLVMGLLYFIFRKSKNKSRSELRHTILIISFLFLLINVFYFLNWIPPVPLALKEGGIYHHVSRSDDGYVLKFEKGSWYHFWKNSNDVYHYQQGDTVFCFAAVFAPTKLNKNIFHHWQVYDDQQRVWNSTDRLGYRIYGGRDGGYRGFTYKRNIQQGKWRVNVETEEGQLLGRISFSLLMSSDPRKSLKTIIR